MWSWDISCFAWSFHWVGLLDLKSNSDFKKILNFDVYDICFSLYFIILHFFSYFYNVEYLWWLSGCMRAKDENEPGWRLEIYWSDFIINIRIKKKQFKFDVQFCLRLPIHSWNVSGSVLPMELPDVFYACIVLLAEFRNR